jgi:hypothetical protein
VVRAVLVATQSIKYAAIIETVFSARSVPTIYKRHVKSLGAVGFL